jgi:hypothetical protein
MVIGPSRAEEALADPDVDVVPAQRCGCARRRRTVHRCAGCGAPVCFHCQTPSIGGKCFRCHPVGGRRAVRMRPAGRLLHGAVALGAGLVAVGMGAATFIRLTAS